jgi:hypothetical protein
MRSYLKQFPGASDIKRHLHTAAEHLVQLFEKNATEKWRWFEDIISYDNAVMPHALFDCYRTTGKEIYLQHLSMTISVLSDAMAGIPKAVPRPDSTSRRWKRSAPQ